MEYRAILLVGLTSLAGMLFGCQPDDRLDDPSPDTRMGSPVPAPDTSGATDTGDTRSLDAGTDAGDPSTDGRDTGDRSDSSTAPTDTGDPADDAADDTGDDTADTAPSRDTGVDTSPDPTDTSSRDTSTADTHEPVDTSTNDTGTATDTATTDTSTTDTAPSCSQPCGTNAHCSGGSCVCDAGFDGDPTGKCYKPKSCQSRSDCGSYALCIDGGCTCEPGFDRRDRTSCTRPSVGEPVHRTKRTVCDRWTSRTTNLTTSIWANRPTSQCATGSLKEVVQWEALDHTNVYRWLIGLDPVHSDPSYIATNQDCATCLAAEGTLSHNLQSSFACYTQDAADGASSSNLAYGVSEPASTIEHYIRDKHVASMGHRRWIFSPGVGATGFGHRGQYGCMWTLDGSGPDTQNDIFYPAPGPFPDEALLGAWSYLSADKLDTSNASVSVTETATGNALSISNLNRLTHGTYGRVTGVAWKVPNATTGTEYRAEISGLGSNGTKTKSYKTTLVTCP